MISPVMPPFESLLWLLCFIMDWNELSPLLSVSKCVWVSRMDPAIIRLQGGLKSQQSADPHKGIFNFLKHLTHTSHLSFLSPVGLTHLPFLKSPECRRLCTVCHLPALMPPIIMFLMLSLCDGPPPSPNPPPAAPFWPPGTVPLREPGEREPGRWKEWEEKGGKRRTLGEKKRLQVWINHNHLSHESVACVTSQRLHTQVTLSNTKCSSSSRGHNRA